jgi:hypothetical protein
LIFARSPADAICRKRAIDAVIFAIREHATHAGRPSALMIFFFDAGFRRLSSLFRWLAITPLIIDYCRFDFLLRFHFSADIFASPIRHFRHC